MSTQRQKHSSGSTRRRRANIHLKKKILSTCKHCNQPKLSHRLCTNCQKYK